MIENCGAVLASFIAAIDRWIMELEKITGQGLKICLLGVESYLNRFCMTTILLADLFVGRVFEMTAGKAYSCRNNSRLLL